MTRCGLLDHVLCKLQSVKHYFEWVWVILGRWDIILGGALFWVGGGGRENILGGWEWVWLSGSEWGWVHCLIMPLLFYMLIPKFKS